MAGLCNSTTGLSFGTGLQFQKQIGGAGLDIVTGPQIDAPTLVLTSSFGTNPPVLTASFDATVLVGDVLVLSYATSPTFSGATEMTHTLDASNILAGSYQFTTPSLADGTWYFRARDTRGAFVSSWSNTVVDVIGSGGAGRPIGLLLALTYAA